MSAAITAAVGGAVVGGLMSRSGSSGSSGSSQQTSTSQPWAGITPYLNGSPTSTRQLKPGVTPIYATYPSAGGGSAPIPKTLEELMQRGGRVPLGAPATSNQTQTLMNPESDYITTTTPGGIYPEAQNSYGTSAWTPAQQGLVDTASTALTADTSDLATKGASFGNSFLNGQYDPSISKINVPGVKAASVNYTDALGGLGVLNPTDSLLKLLSGKVDNTYLDPQAKAITDMLTRNTNENVMPGLRSDAIAAGGYGGSRQGIAEGLAASRLNQDIAPALTSLYGTAFENAQNRMQNTAGNLSGQALNVADSNANRDMLAQQLNAANSLQSQSLNNSQEMQRAAQVAGNKQTGLSTLGATSQQEQADYQALLNLLQQPSNYGWQNLSNYAGIVQPGAGIGGSTTSTASASNPGNAFSGALGGGLLGLDIYNQMKTPASSGSGSGSGTYSYPASDPWGMNFYNQMIFGGN